MQRITNLQDLKVWNKNPTLELPIVLDWYMDWVLGELLKEDGNKLQRKARNEHFKKFKDAFDAMVEFSMICNNSTQFQAQHLTKENLLFWNDRASYYKKYLEGYLDKCIYK